MNEPDPETLLEWLNTGHGEDRDMQLIALEQLCMMLLMSDNIDQCFEMYPPRNYIPSLCNIFLDETATNNVLEVAARAITYFLDVSAECSRRIISVDGFVKSLCDKILCKDLSDKATLDLSEQCVKVLELLCTRESLYVYKSGGLLSIIMFLSDMGVVIHKDTKNSSLNILNKLFNKVEFKDDQLPFYLQSLQKMMNESDVETHEKALKCFLSLSERFTKQGYDLNTIFSSSIINKLYFKLEQFLALVLKEFKANNPLFVTNSSHFFDDHYFGSQHHHHSSHDSQATLLLPASEHNTNVLLMSNPPTNDSALNINNNILNCDAKSAVNIIINYLNLVTNLCISSLHIMQYLLSNGLLVLARKALKLEEKLVYEIFRLFHIVITLILEGQKQLQNNFSDFHPDNEGLVGGIPGLKTASSSSNSNAVLNLLTLKKTCSSILRQHDKQALSKYNIFEYLYRNRDNEHLFEILGKCLGNTSLFHDEKATPSLSYSAAIKKSLNKQDLDNAPSNKPATSRNNDYETQGYENEPSTSNKTPQAPSTISSTAGAVESHKITEHQQHVESTPAVSEINVTLAHKYLHHIYVILVESFLDLNSYILRKTFIGLLFKITYLVDKSQKYDITHLFLNINTAYPNFLTRFSSVTFIILSHENEEECKELILDIMEILLKKHKTMFANQFFRTGIFELLANLGQEKELDDDKKIGKRCRDILERFQGMNDLDKTNVNNLRHVSHLMENAYQQQLKLLLTEGEKDWNHQMYLAFRYLACVLTYRKNENLSVTPYEILSSGLLDTLFKVLSPKGDADTDKFSAWQAFERIEIFFTVFRYPTSSSSSKQSLRQSSPLTILIRKIVEVLEYVENLPQYLHQCPNYENYSGSFPANNMQMLMKKLRFSLKRHSEENGLVDKSGKVLRVEPLVHINSLRHFIYQKVSKQWFEYPRSSYEFVKQFKSINSKALEFIYQSPNDDHGLFHWLGTNAKSTDWINPANHNIIGTRYKTINKRDEEKEWNYNYIFDMDNSKIIRILHKFTSLEFDFGLYILPTAITFTIKKKNVMECKAYIYVSNNYTEWYQLNYQADIFDFYVVYWITPDNNAFQKHQHGWRFMKIETASNQQNDSRQTGGNVENKRGESEEAPGTSDSFGTPKSPPPTITTSNPSSPADSSSAFLLITGNLEIYGTVFNVIENIGTSFFETNNLTNAINKLKRKLNKPIQVQISKAPSPPKQHEGDKEGGVVESSSLLPVGTHVVRGPDWKWLNQDGGQGSTGIVLTPIKDGWVNVYWEKTGITNTYRIGAEGDKYDVTLITNENSNSCIPPLSFTTNTITANATSNKFDTDYRLRSRVPYSPPQSADPILDTRSGSADHRFFNFNIMTPNTNTNDNAVRNDNNYASSTDDSFSMTPHPHIAKGNLSSGAVPDKARQTGKAPLPSSSLFGGVSTGPGSSNFKPGNASNRYFSDFYLDTVIQPPPPKDYPRRPSVPHNLDETSSHSSNVVPPPPPYYVREGGGSLTKMNHPPGNIGGGGVDSHPIISSYFHHPGTVSATKLVFKPLNKLSEESSAGGGGHEICGSLSPNSSQQRVKRISDDTTNTQAEDERDEAHITLMSRAFVFNSENNLEFAAATLVPNVSSMEIANFQSSLDNRKCSSTSNLLESNQTPLLSSPLADSYDSKALAESAEYIDYSLDLNTTESTEVLSNCSSFQQLVTITDPITLSDHINNNKSSGPPSRNLTKIFSQSNLNVRVPKFKRHGSYNEEEEYSYCAGSYETNQSCFSLEKLTTIAEDSDAFNARQDSDMANREINLNFQNNNNGGGCIINNNNNNNKVFLNRNLTTSSSSASIQKQQPYKISKRLEEWANAALSSAQSYPDLIIGATTSVNTTCNREEDRGCLLRGVSSGNSSCFGGSNNTNLTPTLEDDDELPLVNPTTVALSTNNPSNLLSKSSNVLTNNNNNNNKYVKINLNLNQSYYETSHDHVYATTPVGHNLTAVSSPPPPNKPPLGTLETVVVNSNINSCNTSSSHQHHPRKPYMKSNSTSLSSSVQPSSSSHPLNPAAVSLDSKKMGSVRTPPTKVITAAERNNVSLDMLLFKEDDHVVVVDEPSFLRHHVTTAHSSCSVAIKSSGGNSCYLGEKSGHVEMLPPPNNNPSTTTKAFSLPHLLSAASTSFMDSVTSTNTAAATANSLQNAAKKFNCCPVIFPLLGEEYVDDPVQDRDSSRFGYSTENYGNKYDVLDRFISGSLASILSSPSSGSLESPHSSIENVDGKNVVTSLLRRGDDKDPKPNDVSRFNNHPSNLLSSKALYILNDAYSRNKLSFQHDKAPGSNLVWYVSSSENLNNLSSGNEITTGSREISTRSGVAENAFDKNDVLYEVTGRGVSHSLKPGGLSGKTTTEKTSRTVPSILKNANKDNTGTIIGPRFQQNVFASADSEYILTRKYSTLIPAFDPRPGRSNLPQTIDIDLIYLTNQEISMKDNPIQQSLHIPLRLTLKAIHNKNEYEEMKINFDDCKNETIFAVVQSYVLRYFANNNNYSLNERLKILWEPNTFFTLTYSQEKESSSSSVPNVAANQKSDDRLELKNSANSSTAPPTAAAAVTTSLNLLNLLYHLMSNHYKNTTMINNDASTNTIDSDFKELFVSKKITNKLIQQFHNPLALVSNSLPKWCDYLVKDYHILFPYDVRSLFFYAYRFGITRSLTWLQHRLDVNFSAGLERSRQVAVKSRLKHERVKIPRGENELMAYAMTVLKYHSAKKSILEIEFVGEEGTGLGPSLEFYSLVANEFQKKRYGLWLCQENMIDPNNNTDEYIIWPTGLFPVPFAFNTSENIQDSKVNSILIYFEFLGCLMAKAIQDNRLLDIPLSTAFFKIITNLKDDTTSKTDLEDGVSNLNHIFNDMRLIENRTLQVPHTTRNGERFVNINDSNESCGYTATAIADDIDVQSLNRQHDFTFCPGRQEVHENFMTTLPRDDDDVHEELILEDCSGQNEGEDIEIGIIPSTEDMEDIVLKHSPLTPIDDDDDDDTNCYDAASVSSEGLHQRLLFTSGSRRDLALELEYEIRKLKHESQDFWLGGSESTLPKRSMMRRKDFNFAYMYSTAPETHRSQHVVKLSEKDYGKNRGGFFSPINQEYPKHQSTQQQNNKHYHFKKLRKIDNATTHHPFYPTAASNDRRNTKEKRVPGVHQDVSNNSNTQVANSWIRNILRSNDLYCIDPDRARIIDALRRLALVKWSILCDKFRTDEEKIEHISNLKLEIPTTMTDEPLNDFYDCDNVAYVDLSDLCLNFQYNPPSNIYHYQTINLVPDGENTVVNIDNIEEYIDLMTKLYLENGVERQIKAFKTGFDKVFPISSLRGFDPEEMRLMICGEQVPKWTSEDIVKHAQPKLGYTRESPVFLRFANVVNGFNCSERKAFLRFVTGTTSLPPGGLANLKPPLTIVKKIDVFESSPLKNHHEMQTADTMTTLTPNIMSNLVDASYPSVNTCLHYLKLPDYSTESILKTQLLAALKQTGFYLN